MTLRPEVVRERLRKLREVVRNLESVRALPRQQFASSHQHYWVGERGLQLAAEAVFDVGNHILAGHFNVSPADYEDVLERSHEQEALSTALRERLRGLGDFRNLLVHAYLQIDEGRVWDHLQSGLDDFIDYATEVETFLDSL